jgi:hypothetical protein
MLTDFANQRRILSVDEGNLNNWVRIYSDGYEDYHMGSACYAALSRIPEEFNPDYTYKTKDNPVIAFIDNPFTRMYAKGADALSKDECKYLNWVLNESAWAPVFLTKNPKNVFKMGASYDVTYPARYVVQGAILTRYVAEYPDIPEMWNKLVGYRVDPHIALILAHALQELCPDSFRIEKNRAGSGHHAFDIRSIGIAQIRRMVSKKPISFKRMKPFSLSQKYRGLSKIWGEFTILGIRKWPKEKKENPVIVKVFGQDTRYFGFPYTSTPKFVEKFLKLNRLE